MALGVDSPSRTVSPLGLLAVNANWAGLSFMWNALHPIVLPALLVDLVPGQSKNTYLGLLTFAGLVIAMVMQPVSGAISDRWSSPLGRRRPLIIFGTVLDMAFLAVLASAGGMAAVVVGYVGLQISSNTAQGPLQGLMRDRVPLQQLGVASSIKVFVDLLSLVAAAAVAGRLMSDPQSGATSAVFVVALVLMLSALFTVGFTPEHRSDRKEAAARNEAAESAAPGAGYWWLIAERAAFLLGVYGLQAFGQYFLQDALQVADPARQTGNLLAAIGSSTVVLVLAGGWLTDRYGPKVLLYVSSILAAAGLLLMAVVVDLRSLYLSGLIVGAGIGLFMTSNWALANRLAPVARAGRFLGLTNLATAGAAALARLEGPAVDALNAASAGDWLGYRAVFGFGAVCIILSTSFLPRVK